jgi:hypothetical protein
MGTTEENQKYRVKSWGKLRNKEREQGRRYYYSIRNEIYRLLGNKCCECGIDDIRVFQVDHVNGGGNSRKIINRSGQGMLKKRLTEIEKGSKKYQLLCANCNIIKKHENNEIQGHIKKQYYKQDISEVAERQRKTIRLEP